MLKHKYMQASTVVPGGLWTSLGGYNTTTMLTTCSRCNARVDGNEKGWYDHLEVEDGHARYTVRYRLLQCPQCDLPILVEDPIDFDDVEPGILYPAREKVSAAIPRPIASALNEAMNCFRASAHTASVIMCRKALEGMCRERGISVAPLARSLDEMKKKGIIDAQLEEWASLLRVSGNDAAHDMEVTFEARDARDILDFTVALGEYLFTFKQKFDEFVQRRSKRKP